MKIALFAEMMILQRQEDEQKCAVHDQPETRTQNLHLRRVTRYPFRQLAPKTLATVPARGIFKQI